MEQDQVVKIETDGTFQGTKVSIDEKQIKCQGVTVSGDAFNDMDVVIVVSTSKSTERAAKAQDKMLSQAAGETNVIGFQVDDDEDDFLDDDEDDE